MNDDIFAAFDDEQDHSKSPAAQVAHPKPLSADLSNAKRKADPETEESNIESQKRLRSTGVCCFQDCGLNTSKTFQFATLPE